MVQVLTHKDNQVFSPSLLFFAHLFSPFIIFTPSLLHPDLQLRCLLIFSPTCPWSCGPCLNSPVPTASVCNKVASSHSPFAPGSCKSCCEDIGSHFFLGQLQRPLSSHLQLHKELQLPASPPW